MARITINDIARISGYSKTTVSFAFNDPGRIGEATRAKILGIARDLGYIPDPVARNLSMKRHGTIGLLLPDDIPLAFDNSYMAQIVRGIGEVCERDGHSLTLIPPIRESLLEGVRSAAVDGIITIGLEPGPDTVEIIRHRHLPFVAIDGRPGGGFPVIGIDDRSAAEAIMSHVLDQGCTTIGLVAFADLAEVRSTSHVRVQRLEGYRNALGKRDHALLDDLVVTQAPASVAGGREAAQRLLSSSTRPDAIVAMCDVIALGVLAYAEEAGITVPQDVIVTGFDGIPESDIVRPRLTTISQPGYLKGRHAADLLMRLVAGVAVEDHVELPATLVVRTSSRRTR